MQTSLNEKRKENRLRGRKVSVGQLQGQLTWMWPKKQGKNQITAQQKMETWLESLEESTSANRTGTNLGNSILVVNSSSELEKGLFWLSFRYLKINSPPIPNVCPQRQLPITISYSVSSSGIEVTQKMIFLYLNKH